MRIHVLRVPEHEIRRMPAGVMWCFRCRKHLPHDKVMFVPDDPMSSYGPRWNYECSNCRQDHTAFPGMEREYSVD